MWEEPCISGEEGSGTIFFSGCTLRCRYCQNYQIADSTVGKAVSVEKLASIMTGLQKRGANNINLVTPTQFVPQIIEALNLARSQGLSIPIVYNTSGYEKRETLEELNGYVDIYLPDFKYVSKELAQKFSKAENYPSVVKSAIREMVKQTGLPLFDERGMMKKGVIVRHLVLPGHTKESMQVIKDVYETFGNEVYLSIMSQYTPVREIPEYKELNRKLTRREYNRVIDYALELGVEQAYVQDGDTAKDSFIPAFDYEGIDGKCN